jgi:hypothetical protein
LINLGLVEIGLYGYSSQRKAVILGVAQRILNGARGCEARVHDHLPDLTVVVAMRVGK